MDSTSCCGNTHIEMFLSIRSAAVTLLALVAPTFAQLQSEPAGLRVLKSRFGEGVTITYKEVRIPCKRSI